MRVEQPLRTRGSLRWIQALVGDHRAGFEAALRQHLDLRETSSFNWLSPLAEDAYAEYRDGASLTRLSLPQFATDLAAFWPTRGPQWDALATTTEPRQVLLVEAKAHIGELRSSCTAKPKSRIKIHKALKAAKRHYGVTAEKDWAQGYYQYANRLAHLYFLRQRGVDAHLIFVYFINDADMKGPTSVVKWKAGLKKMYESLGLLDAQPPAAVHNLFVDVEALRDRP